MSNERVCAALAKKFPRLNGNLPRRDPSRVPSGTALITKDSLWMSKNHGIVMVVLSVQGTHVFFRPNGTPGEEEYSIPTSDFRDRYLPWDLVPD